MCIEHSRFVQLKDEWSWLVLDAIIEYCKLTAVEHWHTAGAWTAAALCCMKWMLWLMTCGERYTQTIPAISGVILARYLPYWFSKGWSGLEIVGNVWSGHEPTRLHCSNKKAVLSQRWPRDAPYIWVPVDRSVVTLSLTVISVRKYGIPCERLGTQLLLIFAVTNGAQRRLPINTHVLKTHVHTWQTSTTSLSLDGPCHRNPREGHEYPYIPYISRH